MADTEKRGPGRPKKSFDVLTTEAPMADLERNEEVKADAAPVSRGLREAALRAEEIRNKLRGEQYDSQMYDEFYIDPRIIPEGWDYNWKRESIAGQIDDDHLVEMCMAGWEPVDVKRHPHMMPVGYTGPIRKKGMILMERPMEITNMAQDRELSTAREAVIAKERALGLSPAGTFERDRAKSGVKKSYQPINVPQN